jgi:hypothetical protein
LLSETEACAHAIIRGHSDAKEAIDSPAKLILRVTALVFLIVFSTAHVYE